MEAAAILVHGASLPPDRSLWPSYTSGGSLTSPTDGSGPKAHFGDDELQEVAEVDVEVEAEDQLEELDLPNPEYLQPHPTQLQPDQLQEPSGSSCAPKRGASSHSFHPIDPRTPATTNEHDPCGSCSFDEAPMARSRLDAGG